MQPRAPSLDLFYFYTRMCRKGDGNERTQVDSYSKATANLPSWPEQNRTMGRKRPEMVWF